MTDKEKFINHINDNYDELKRKFNRACRDLQLTLTDDLFQDTIIKCYDSIEKKGKLNDSTPYGIESYFFQSLKMNIKRESQYARETKRDKNISSENIHQLYEDFYNTNSMSSNEKLLSDLYKDFAILYICKQVEMNFDNEYYYLFRIKYLTNITYKELAEKTNMKKVRQKVVEVKNWVKQNITKEMIKKEFNFIYGDLIN